MPPSDSTTGKTATKQRKKYFHLRFEGDLIVDKRGIVYGIKITAADKLIVPYGSRTPSR